MSLTPRFLVESRIQARETGLLASSQYNSMPVGFLRDQSRTMVYRSASGWTFNAFNNKLDFNRGGVKAATLASLNYGNGAVLATQIQAALTAADGAVTWTVSYSVSTFKLTIQCSAAFVLLFGTGTNLATSCALDLGFAAADTGSATSHTAANAAYQSRHFLRADLGSALSTQAGIVINHNAGTGGTFTHQAHATDAWTAPTVNQVLAGDADIRIAFFATQTLRWRRLVINDVSNSAGYSEVGIWYDGPYVEVAKFQAEYSETPEELSAVQFSMSGAHVQDRRSIRDVKHLLWKVTVAQLALIRGVGDDTPVGTNFFFCPDPVGAPTDTLYCYRPSPMPKAALGSHLLWTQQMSLAKAL